MLIAQLAAERRCYEPERIDATWARLRHLGARRAALTTEATAAVQQLWDLLECVWPAVLAAAGGRFGPRPGVPRWASCWSAAVAIRSTCAAPSN
jgi:transposase